MVKYMKKLDFPMLECVFIVLQHSHELVSLPSAHISLEGFGHSEKSKVINFYHVSLRLGDPWMKNKGLDCLP